MLLLLLVHKILFLVKLIDNMHFITFKSIHVFSNGSLFFSRNNYIRYKVKTLFKKDLKNFELNKKKKMNFEEKLKYSSNHKNKYITYK